MPIKPFKVKAELETMEDIKGDLVISSDNFAQYAALKRVKGNLSVIARNVVFKDLKMVDGNLAVNGGKVLMPVLEQVTGHVQLGSGAVGFRAFGLRFVRSMLIKARDVEFPKITKITNGMIVSATNVSFPALTEVLNGLIIKATGAEFPELTKVTKVLRVEVPGIKMGKLERIDGTYQCVKGGELMTLRQIEVKQKEYL
jgi:hypothetical protein